MKKSAKSFRSPLGRVTGLGSAKAGTAHWWMQRVTAVAMIPLALWPLACLVFTAAWGDYGQVVGELRSPYVATAIILFLAVAFHHAASGVQVVIEDYVHCECAKTASIIAIKFAAAAFALLGILAAGKILFGA